VVVAGEADLPDRRTVLADFRRLLRNELADG
jgi:hypothetical protein